MDKLIVENSLYSNDVEKQEFLNNKEALITSFYVNVFGTLGLYKLDSKKTRMQQYYIKDKKLQLPSINDENNDTSLVIKLMVEKGYLRTEVANKMTRFLVIMKRRPEPASIDENLIRDWLKESRFNVNKPALRLLPAIKKFADGDYSLPQLAAAMWNFLRRNKEIAAYCKEFMNISVQYRSLLNKTITVDKEDEADVNPNIAKAVLIDRRPLPSLSLSDILNFVTFEYEKTDSSTKKLINMLNNWGLIPNDTNTTNIDDIIKKVDTSRLTLILSEYVDTGHIRNTRVIIESQSWMESFISDNNILRMLSKIDSRLGPIYSSIYTKSMSSELSDSAYFMHDDDLIESLASVYKEYPEISNHFKYIFSKYFENILNREFYRLRDLNSLNYRIFLQKVYLPILIIKETFPSNEPVSDAFAFLFADKTKASYFALWYTYMLTNRKDFPSDSSIESAFNNFGIYPEQGKITSSQFSDTKPEIFDLILNRKDDWWDFNIHVDGHDKNEDFIYIRHFIESFKNDNVYMFDESIFFNELNKRIIKGKSAFSGVLEEIRDEYDSIPEDMKLDLRLITGKLFISYSAADNIKFAAFLKLMIEKSDFTFEEQKENLIAGEVAIPVNNRDNRWAKWINQKCEAVYNNLEYFKSKPYVLYGSFLDAGSDVAVKWVNRKDIDEIFYKVANIYKDNDSHFAKRLYEFRDILDHVLTKNKNLPNFYSLLYEYLENKHPGNRQLIIFTINQQSFINWIRENRIVYINGENSIIEFLHVRRSDKILTKYDFSAFEVRNDEDTLARLREDEILAILNPNYKKLIVKFDPNLNVDYYSSVIKKSPDEFFSVLAQSNDNGLKGLITELNKESDGISTILSVIKKESTDKDPHEKLTSFSKLINIIDSSNPEIIDVVKSLTKELGNKHNDSRGILLDVVGDLVVNESIPEEMRSEIWESQPIGSKRIIAARLKPKFIYTETVKKIGLFGDEEPIRPYNDIHRQDMEKILKLNNIIPSTQSLSIDHIDPVSLRSSDIKTFKLLNEYIRGSDQEIEFNIQPLHVTELEETQAQLDIKTIEFDAFNKYKHGGHSIKFLRSFDVDIPIQREQNELWRQELIREGKESQIMKRVFHGTGSIAASFILRAGFAVPKDWKAGRMLGDGIYFTNVLDKASLYVGDDSYLKRGRQIGVKGYIFEMEASLGEKGVDYKDETDRSSINLISPEWVVFRPNYQLRIYRAHEVELVDSDYMAILKSQYPTTAINENLTMIKTFREFISEANGEALMKHAITYMFKDGTLPTKNGPVEPSKWKSRNKNVKVGHTAWGPSITIYNNTTTYRLAVMDTREFINSGEADQFFDEIEGNII